MNFILLVGTITREPKLNWNAKGATCFLSLKTVEIGSDGREHPAFHNIACWEKVAEQVGEYRVNDIVMVEGSLGYRKIEEKWEAQIRPRKITKLGGLVAEIAKTGGGGVVDTDDIPFISELDISNTFSNKDIL